MALSMFNEDIEWILMNIVKNYESGLSGIHSKTDELSALPISQSFHQLALMAIPKHEINNKWKEFLFHYSSNNNMYISENVLVTAWKKWLSRSRLYSNLSRGKAKYNSQNTNVITLGSSNPTSVAKNNNQCIDTAAEAKKVLMKYNHSQLVAFGYDPITGLRKEWSN